MELAVVIGVLALAVAVIEVVKAPLWRPALLLKHLKCLGCVFRHGQGAPAGGVRQPLLQAVQLHLRRGEPVAVEAAVAVLKPRQRPAGQIHAQRPADTAQRPAFPAVYSTAGQ